MIRGGEVYIIRGGCSIHDQRR